jgi:CRISPR-associated protein Csc2
MTGLGADEYVKPESFFVEIETLKDITADELRYVLGSILRTKRYGAISSRIGKVKNMLCGVAFSNCELFSNLELTQAVYDALKGDNEELEFPLETEQVVEAVRQSSRSLSGRVMGQVKWLTGDEITALQEELIALYSDEEAIAAMLEGMTYE